VIVQPGAAFANADAKAHDRVAVNAGEAFDRCRPIRELIGQNAAALDAALDELPGILHSGTPTEKGDAKRNIDALIQLIRDLYSALGSCERVGGPPVHN
jgi:hypothetical protein